jgi:hypothetical protein
MCSLSEMAMSAQMGALKPGIHAWISSMEYSQYPAGNGSQRDCNGWTDQSGPGGLLGADVDTDTGGPAGALRVIPDIDWCNNTAGNGIGCCL